MVHVFILHERDQQVYSFDYIHITLTNLFIHYFILWFVLFEYKKMLNSRSKSFWSQKHKSILTYQRRSPRILLLSHSDRLLSGNKTLLAEVASPSAINDRVVKLFDNKSHVKNNCIWAPKVAQFQMGSLGDKITKIRGIEWKRGSVGDKLKDSFGDSALMKYKLKLKLKLISGTWVSFWMHTDASMNARASVEMAVGGTTY